VFLIRYPGVRPPAKSFAGGGGPTWQPFPVGHNLR